MYKSERYAYLLLRFFFIYLIDLQCFSFHFGDKYIQRLNLVRKFLILASDSELNEFLGCLAVQIAYLQYYMFFVGA